MGLLSDLYSEGVKGDSPVERSARRLKVGVKNAVGLRGVKRVTVLAGPARGVTMTLDLAGQTPMYLGMFEWELHRFFRAALAQSELIFDIGGYIGYDALLFAANCHARVVTFEPDEQRAGLIAQNLACNPEIEPQVMVTITAVGSSDDDRMTTIDTITKSLGRAGLHQDGHRWR